ncbi:MAG: nucleotide exchange factor GrpE [Candidatus Nealsonbacteria bacterium]|nr:nucleotide exchange factor GrpE [Candidatus Nealsonbacteria bacterium]
MTTKEKSKNKKKKNFKEEKEELEKQLKECQAQKESYLDGWQRERANFINYKKEEMERVEGLVKYANTGLLMKIFPILDNFDAAEKEIPQKIKEEDNIKGLLQIKKQLRDFLKKEGVEEIECEGKRFDPALHEAVEMIDPEKGVESGVVVEEIQKGYVKKGEVLRPAKVKVSK